MSRIPNEEKIKGYKNLFKYLRYFNKYRVLCIGFWGLLFISGIISFFSPMLLGNIISAVSASDFNNAIKYAWLLFAIEIVSLIVGVLKVPFFKNLENRVKMDVKLDVIKSSFKINIGVYEKMGNGVFITRLTRDLDSLASSYKSISETIVSFMAKLGFIVYIFAINIYLGLFLVGFILIRYYVYKIRVHYFSILKPIVHKRAETVNSSVGETIRGIKDIKTLGLQPSLLSQIESQQFDYLKADNKEWYVGVTLSTIATFVRVVCNLLFVLLCVWLITNGHIAVTIFYTAYIYKNSVMDFAVHLGNLQDYFKDLEVSAYRVFDLKDSVKYKFAEFGTHDYPEYEGNIEFDDVHFNYGQGQDVLDGVNFKIKKNTHVAFVGESGCGKSTIVSLICKLHKPVSGTIKFDNKKIEDLSENFFKNVSMVNQFPYLFNMTIRENMQLVKPKVTDEEIYEALKLANADEFIRALPNKLDSFLGEGGTRLSGGQKQRICIARALLKDSKVLIFDEATSSLDNLSQEKIIGSINELRKNKTIITIAHRLSTIIDCDEIFFVSGGKIVDSGTHDKLMKTNATYKALYIKQQKDKVNEE